MFAVQLNTWPNHPAMLVGAPGLLVGSGRPAGDSSIKMRLRLMVTYNISEADLVRPGLFEAIWSWHGHVDEWRPR